MKKITFALTLILLLALTLSAIGCAEEETPTFFLEITQPADGAQVNTSSVLVSGKTTTGAVVSISVNGNDEVEIANVDQNGNFDVNVVLEEGLNLIEVVASDQEGNEKFSSIIIDYVP